MICRHPGLYHKFLNIFKKMVDSEDSEKLNMLGETLYNKIYPVYPNSASKLTGMLLELPLLMLEQMVEDDQLLSRGLKKALDTLTQTSAKSYKELQKTEVQCDSMETLGEELYDLVDVYKTGHSEKITGMLLELGKEQVKQLLVDPHQLERCIHTALKTLQQAEAPEKQKTLNLDSKNIKEKLAEKLFTEVENIDANNSATITGMLLEMESSFLHTIINDKKAIEDAVTRAQAALTESPVPQQSSSSQRMDEDSDMDSETEMLGEDLYNFISSTQYTDHAEKIAGILLEMPHSILRKLLTSPEELKEKIKCAAKVLEDAL
ncbi:uncharacterized protein LOC122790988 [Protopterus annectens]|uniref:uncharacterized protein LOC122790988 n=1 Tax=Protopterus annectens TaxID=7888 RepID=UPI001CFA4D3F|nr:uncharacterized protein LOC122790988 [Protopterus annectens]